MAKAKSPRVKKPKRLLELVKFYFSSLTARGCKFLYLNCTEDKHTFVFTNGDEELLTMEAPSLSIHLVRFKDESFYQEFMQELDFNISMPYILNLKKVLTVVSSCLNDNTSIRTYLDPENQVLFTTNDDERQIDLVIADERQKAFYKLRKDLASKAFFDNLNVEMTNEEIEAIEDELDVNPNVLEVLQQHNITIPLLEYSHAYGSPFTDFRTKGLMFRQIEYVKHVADEFPKNTLAFQDLDFTTLKKSFSNLYFVPFKTSDFLTLNGEKYFTDPNYQEDMKYILQDGLDIPSVVEFVKKLPMDSWKKRLTLFIDTTRIIKCISCLESDNVFVVSMRPLNGVFPRLLNTQ